jgi:uncharacterized membrane protein
MKNRLVLFLGALSVALLLPAAAVAADGPLAPKSAAKGSTGKLTMAEKASFHKVHSKPVVKIGCEDCHSKTPLPDNTISLRLNDKLAKKDPGPVDHENCFDCHRRTNKPLPYFAKKE